VRGRPGRLLGLPNGNHVHGDGTATRGHRIVYTAMAAGQNGRGRGVRHMGDRISIDPHICHGRACVKGTRIPVYQIVRMLANGDTSEGLLGDYPSLTREDVLACLEYAAALAEEQTTPLADLVEA